MQEHDKEKKNIFRRPEFQSLIAAFLIFGLLAGFLIYVYSKNYVSIEDSHIEAPIVNLSPAVSGILNAVYVKEGDSVSPGTEVARIGSESLISREGGIVSVAPKATGNFYAPGQTAVSIIVESRMRAVGTIEETKGLSLLKAGQAVVFTVDAFPGNEYIGKVDSVSPTSVDNSVTFSISDKRPIKKFNVYVAFDRSKYPELRNGMSAKIKIDVR